ncbi:MAG TPA: hypothetical protein PKZ84_17710 [Anaerolineae bacterium]|nr:hypothetical protein [Anaerolineae bacterium]HQI86411.1 hypothetical protein [Anaerolineae bacterium]
MNVWLWLLVGALAGWLNVASIAGLVARLRPGGDVWAVSALAGGFAVRLGLAALVLSIALRQDALAGLLAFAGMWLARWVVLFWTRTKGAIRLSTADL